MEKCIYCQQETQLHLGGRPVCVTCFAHRCERKPPTSEPATFSATRSVPLAARQQTA